MADLQFTDLLQQAGPDGFGRVTGSAVFPYFNREIEVICHEGVTPEYAAKSLQWLAAVDEGQMREICQYAWYYLQDQLEATSVGELLDEGVEHIQDPLEVLRYMEFGALDIHPPQDPEVPVLNLSGGCAWREDEGLQCLLRGGRVVYLGTWDDWDVWDKHLLDEDRYLCNYVLYPRRAELRQRAAERCARWEPLPHLEFAIGAPVRYFVEVLLAQEARCTRTEAWTRLEGTRLMELLREDPALAWTRAPLLFQCWCMERDQGAVAMEVYLWEQTHPEG